MSSQETKSEHTDERKIKVNSTVMLILRSSPLDYISKGSCNLFFGENILCFNAFLRRIKDSC